MSTIRMFFGAVVLKGFIYAIGGHDGNTWLNSVERYDPKTNTWTTVAPMHHKRGSPGVTVYKGKILALGGSQIYAQLNSVELYHAETNTWALLSVPLPSKRTLQAVSM